MIQYKPCILDSDDTMYHNAWRGLRAVTVVTDRMYVYRGGLKWDGEHDRMITYYVPRSSYENMVDMDTLCR